MTGMDSTQVVVFRDSPARSHLALLPGMTSCALEAQICWNPGQFPTVCFHLMLREALQHWARRWNFFTAQQRVTFASVSSRFLVSYPVSDTSLHNSSLFFSLGCKSAGEVLKSLGSKNNTRSEGKAGSFVVVHANRPPALIRHPGSQPAWKWIWPQRINSAKVNVQSTYVTVLFTQFLKF